MTENAEAEMTAQFAQLEASEKFLHYKLNEKVRVMISRNPDSLKLLKLKFQNQDPVTLGDSEVEELLAALVFVKRLISLRSRHYKTTQRITSHIRLRNELKFRLGRIWRAFYEGKEVMED